MTALFRVGWRYRWRMRWAHRRGYCWPQPVSVEPGAVWCHWCGMRGATPLPPDSDRMTKMMKRAESLGQ